MTEHGQDDLPLLTEPADGAPRIVADEAGLADVCRQLAAGHSPVGLDTERAHGFRYRSSAYLVQLRSPETGTVLVDPVPFGIPADLSVLGAALAKRQWILHAASQDLPCLREAGMLPSTLFDTELAGRLLNLPRVGLGPLIEREFGVRLLKEHSAADWSSRPLTADWLSYAALDVELLIPLREHLIAQLEAAGKDEWARQEFAHLVVHADDEPEVREDPWRRTSGMHALRQPAQLALVRELWQARDEIAQRLDKGPAKILLDRAISALAELVDARKNEWPDRAALRRIDGFNRRYARRFESNWVDAIERVKAMPRSQWPPLRLSHDGPPAQPRTWESRHPDEYRRWQLVRPVQLEVAKTLDVPPENLLSPAALRQLAWTPPPRVSAATVGDALAEAGARPWQVEHLAGPLAAALSA